MPVIANENSRLSRLSWLMGRLAERRRRCADLLRRLTGMGPRGAIKPSLFAKFLHMLDDVAAATKEEASLIGRIEEIEQKHRFMRDGKHLKQALPTAKTAAILPQPSPDHEAAQPSYGLLKLMVVWYLFMRQKINHKKQGLTAD